MSYDPDKHAILLIDKNDVERLAKEYISVGYTDVMNEIIEEF